MVARIAVAFALTFVVGFERELRGGSAGDRTYSLVGTAAAAIAAIAVAKGAGNAIAGIITGVGFLGAALLFHSEGGGPVRGITSGAAILAATAIGVVAGAGYPLVAAAATGLVLLTLELRYAPVLRYPDSRRYQGTVAEDDEPPSARRPRRRPR